MEGAIIVPDKDGYHVGDNAQGVHLKNCLFAKPGHPQGVTLDELLKQAKEMKAASKQALISQMKAHEDVHNLWSASTVNDAYKLQTAFTNAQWASQTVTHKSYTFPEDPYFEGGSITFQTGEPPKPKDDPDPVFLRVSVDVP